jgi:hypothetical protein
MHSAVTIARLVGPVMSAMGIGMLANTDAYRQIGVQFVAGQPFIYFSGVLILLAGLAILNAHHAWTRDWRSLITAIGWAFTGIGTFRLIGLQFVGFIGGSFLTSSGFFLGAGVFFLTLGGYLTFKGYVA